MASTYTSNLRLTKQGDGDNPNTWGQILNEGVISLVDEAIAGYQTITLGSAVTVTLTNNQGSGDQARSAVLEFNGSVGDPNSAIYVLIPNNSKTYVIKNSVSYSSAGADIILRVAGNTGATIAPANTGLYVTNGTTVLPVGNNIFSDVYTTNLTVSVSAAFPDNSKANFGTGSDLKIYHDASNSYILEDGTGDLVIASNNGANVKIQGSAETLAIFADDGAASLYYNDGVKLATTNTGAQITGTLLATTDTDTTNSGSITLDFETNQNFILTLTGNITLANPTTEQVGQSGVITFIQDGTGSRTLTLGSQYKTAGGADITLSTAAAAVDVVPYFVQSADNILLGSIQKAFS
jgi:hypothetical protein